MLIHNVGFKGKNKLADCWLSDVYRIIDQPNADIPVYSVEKGWLWWCQSIAQKHASTTSLPLRDPEVHIPTHVPVKEVHFRKAYYVGIHISLGTN